MGSFTAGHPVVPDQPTPVRRQGLVTLAVEGLLDELGWCEEIVLSLCCPGERPEIVAAGLLALNIATRAPDGQCSPGDFSQFGDTWVQSFREWKDACLPANPGYIEAHGAAVRILDSLLVFYLSRVPWEARVHSLGVPLECQGEALVPTISASAMVFDVEVELGQRPPERFRDLCRSAAVDCGLGLESALPTASGVKLTVSAGKVRDVEESRDRLVRLVKEQLLLDKEGEPLAGSVTNIGEIHGPVSTGHGARHHHEAAPADTSWWGGLSQKVIAGVLVALIVGSLVYLGWWFPQQSTVPQSGPLERPVSSPSEPRPDADPSVAPDAAPD